MSEPERTCVGCRRPARKGSLTRLVWSATTGGVVLDPRQVLAGRGAYLHPACAGRALRARALGRALRRSVDGAQVAELLTGLAAGQ